LPTLKKFATISNAALIFFVFFIKKKKKMNSQKNSKGFANKMPNPLTL